MSARKRLARGPEETARKSFRPSSANLQVISRLLDLSIGQQNHELTFGPSSQTKERIGRRVSSTLMKLAAAGSSSPSKGDTECLINLALTHPKADLDEYLQPFIKSPLAHRQVMARTETQRRYVQTMEKTDLVFNLGPAGTGKTYLTIAMAITFLDSGQVSHIIITRPTVETGERLGFLPCDLTEKINPYLRPLYGAINDLIPYEKYARLAERQLIEMAPLAFMRGHTLSQTFIILDEAQNTTRTQMKIFLTRLGPCSRTVITSDPGQNDLPGGNPAGLKEAVALLANIPGIKICHFSPANVIRHHLVRAIINAYDNANNHQITASEKKP
ncbi:MAG: PhoH family protein [Candidatus Adiutrix intracellularis]|nr:PhoH family protein [Candidatus Adiutrix intracellularis]